MYHRGREKMRHLIIVAVFILNYPRHTLHKSIATPRPETNTLSDDNLDNTIIDFEEDYTVRFNKKYGIPLDADNYFNKDSHRYTLIKDYDKELDIKGKNKSKILDDENTTVDYSVIPLELISTTENILHVTKNIEESENLKVIPLTTEKLLIFDIKQIVLSPSTTESERNTEFFTENIETITEVTEGIAQSELVETKKRGDREIIATTEKIRTKIVITEKNKENIKVSTKDSFKDSKELKQTITEEAISVIDINNENQTNLLKNTSTEYVDTSKTISKLNYDKDSNKVTTIVINTNDDSQTSTPSTNITKTHKNSSNLNFNGDPNRIDKKITRRNEIDVTLSNLPLNIGSTNKTQPNFNASDDNNNKTTLSLKVENKNTNKNKTSVNITLETINRSDSSSTEEIDVPIFTELDTEDLPDVPEDYYDTKDVVPTTAPKTDALSVIFGLAGSVVESVVGSVAERVVPKSIYDLFKRMQRQNEALEAERLRSPEENGGLGHFGRGILKSISTGISKPLSQLMAGVRDIGSLDSDRGFVNSLASGVTSVANAATSLVDAFKDRVQAIYPGTVWCGDGRSATARSSDLGLFFFTDTCCRQHDACKLYIRSGETKYGLTNTGIFTRSHCSCDAKFRECLQRTNSLVSAQIGLTYFNVLGPQCFRRAHPIVKCVRRTRITGQRCEEYELDYTKPRMWQWFDNETY